MSDEPLVAVFDLDGTLLDSDLALLAPFVSLGIDPSEVRFGPLPVDECRRLGLDPDDYFAEYDTTAAAPFEGVSEVLGDLERWGVCSNKHPDAAGAELGRLGWRPEATHFAGAGTAPKRLEPVLDQMCLSASGIVFIGDTDHDRRLAAALGSVFALAAWNPRAEPRPGDVVLEHPREVLSVLRR